MGRPREHDEATRVLLLDAAERIVDERGPAALSVRGAAEAAGTTTRAVYALFGSKEGLLAGLATRLFEMLGTAIDAVPLTGDPAADVVEASVRGFRRTALEHPSLYGLVFLGSAPGLHLGPDFGRTASATFGRLEALLARVGEAGGLGGRSPREAARVVHALTEGLATMELRGVMGDAGRAEAVWRDAVASLLRGFAG